MKKISIIIPTLNESLFINKTLDIILSKRFYNIRPEIILVDSGSSDNTIDLASRYGVKIISFIPSKSGKHELLNKGAESSTGDFLLFLDADTLAPSNYDLLITRAFGQNNIVGGAFEFTLDGCEFGLRVVELLNRIRYRVRGSFYGDQGLFVKREVFFKAGMFPNRRLFETAELCKKLRKFGKLRLVTEHSLTSPRRFIEGGIYKVLINDIKLWLLNEFKIYPEDKLADIYWDYNIKSKINKQ
jgi:glycosyltransferase involved in cell wall biosynthesis